MPMDSISMCSSTFYMCNMDEESSLRWLSWSIQLVILDQGGGFGEVLTWNLREEYVLSGRVASDIVH